MPIVPAKTEGPATKLIFLDRVGYGLIHDEPPLRKARTPVLIRDWESKKSCTKRELLSLIGYLQHACRVIKPGRSGLTFQPG